MVCRHCHLDIPQTLRLWIWSLCRVWQEMWRWLECDVVMWQTFITDKKWKLCCHVSLPPTQHNIHSTNNFRNLQQLISKTYCFEFHLLFYHAADAEYPNEVLHFKSNNNHCTSSEFVISVAFGHHHYFVTKT